MKKRQLAFSTRPAARQRRRGEWAWRVLGFAAALGVVAAPVAAQTAAPSAPAPARDVTAVGEIVVTAERRSANLQKVPIAVTALSADDTVQKGLTGVLSLSAAVPGLVINNPANVGNPFLRGVGSNLFDPSSEQSVATYVDGVYIAAPESNLFNFNNIQRIEVLKGPQGTLFGRNATGGVIQIVTRDPSQRPTADFSVGYANYDDVSASFYGASGLTDTLAADIAALFENQGNGYGRNFTTGAQTFREAIGNFAVRSKVLFTPTPSTAVRLSADYAHSVETNAYQKPPGVFSPIDGSTYPGPYNALGSLDDRNRVNTGGVSLQIDQDLPFARLVSITAYRQSDILYALDDDVTAIPVADIILAPRAHNWSQEMQIVSPDKGWLKWMVGAYYYSALGEYAPVTIDGSEQVADSQSSVSYAGFGQATARLPWRTNLTVGVRYTTETQDFALTFPATLDEQQTFDKLTYRFALDHQFSDDILGYVSFNRGFKSGGFNLLAPGNSFRPETLDATEAGLKTQLFDHRLRLNLAAFSYQYQDIQLSLPILGGLIVTNAAAAHIRGLEADFEAVPLENLTLSGGLSLLHGRYTNYPGAVPLNEDGVPGPPINEAGNHTVVTPPVTATFTIDYRIHTGLGDVRPALTVIYNDGYFWQTDNRLVQPAYTLLNTSLTWSSPAKTYDVQLWAKNLTDATYYIARITVAGIGDVQEQAAPRTYGVTLRAHF